MRITKEQEAILDSLVCERLRDNDINGELIQDFRNKRGDLIVDYLKQYGLKEDKDGDTAFYIVKTKDEDVLMFFSLKCGELFDSLFDEEGTEENYEEYLLISQALKNVDADPKMQEKAINYLKNISKAKGIPISKALNNILHETKTKKEMLELLKSDKKFEDNENISRVNRTYPGVELVHFCINENAKKKWDSFMGRLCNVHILTNKIDILNILLYNIR